MPKDAARSPIALRDLDHCFRSGAGSHRALASVTIDAILPGSIVGITGHNGAGKSTLVAGASGRLELDGGSVQYSDGAESRLFTPDGRRALIDQTPLNGLVPEMSALENLILRSVLRLRLSPRDQHLDRWRDPIIETLREYALDDLIPLLDRLPSELSGGQQQLLAIAATVAAGTELLFLDEPTSRLDEANRIKVWQLLVRLACHGRVTLFVATHDLEMVERVADRVVRLTNGAVVEARLIDRTEDNPRFAGEVRFARKLQIAPDWFAPSNGQTVRLFPEAYRMGDDSHEGALAGRPMTRSIRTAREVTSIISLLGLTGSETVIDVPCGWGRHLARLGDQRPLLSGSNSFVAVGLDLCFDYLRSREAGSYLAACADMRALPLATASADVVLNLWQSFGFFHNDSDNLLTLREWYRVLRAGGRVLVYQELNPRRVRLGIFDEPSERCLGASRHLHVEEAYNRERDSIEGTWTILSTANSETPVVESTHAYQIAIWSEEKWRERARSIGFRVIEFFGALDGSRRALDDRCQEFVVVLTK